MPSARFFPAAFVDLTFTGERPFPFTPVLRAADLRFGAPVRLRACAAFRNRFQHPPPVAERYTKLFEIALRQLRQYVDIDVIRFEHVRVLLEIVPAEPIANSAHTVKLLPDDCAALPCVL